jgi:hypothetical protein
LSRCLHLDALQFLIFFSSVVGRTGNAGQCDYVAANETVNKLAVWLDGQMPGRVASIMWGPWNGGMAQPELESIFARYGWSMIDAADGRATFINELTRGQKGQVEVLLVGQLESTTDQPESTFTAGNVAASGARLRHARGLSKGPGEVEFALTLNLDEDLYLNDHCFDGIPVMPMAMAMELMAEAVESVYPEWKLARLVRLDIPSGIVFDGTSKDIVVSIKQESQTENLTRVQVALQTGIETRRRANFKMVAELIPTQVMSSAETIALPPTVEPRYSLPKFRQPVSMIPSVASLYEQWLFHGPLFQGITAVNAMGENGISGEVTISRPEKCLGNAGDSSWAIDPIMWDSAMQLAGVWARNYLDMTVLPTGFARLHVFGKPAEGPLKVIVDVPVESKHGQLLCNLAVYAQDGSLLMLAEDLGGIGSRSFNRLSTPAKELRPVR